MKRKRVVIIPLVVLALFVPFNASTDFDKGMAAYQADYCATALALGQPTTHPT